MKDMESQFREHSNSIRIQPHHSTWDRIDGKLSVHRSRGKILNARLLSIAAAIALLITVSVSIYFFQYNQEDVTQRAYSMSIEELASVTQGDEGIFDVERIRRSYRELIN